MLQKIYHHTLVLGGYKTAEPKWDMEESIVLETEDWPVMSRNWVLGHGGAYDT
jgi:hypothetical protein